MRQITVLRFASAAAVAILIAATIVTQAMPQAGDVGDNRASKEAAFRELVREQATQDVQKSYAPVFDDLDLPASEEEALRSFLIENWIARTTTPYWRGVAIDLNERANGIAEIIGDAKLQQFLEFERNLYLHGEIQRIATMLQMQGFPLNDAQRDGLFGILVDARDQAQAFSLPPGIERNSVEYLEHRTLQKDEFERLILEQAPTVLSPKQVGLLSEQYEYLSYKRAYALKEQEREAADPNAEDKPMWYPTWGN
jgi:hypothetical protein